MEASNNLGKWRFTWEALSHSPTLKLFLFDSSTKPSIRCANLEVHLHLSRSHLLVSWTGEASAGEPVSLRVPIPRVLIDPDSPVSLRSLDDHIEVRLVLLLPVDHPIVSSFDSVLNLSGGGEYSELSDRVEPLTMDSDIKGLSSMEGVDFFCRSCSAKLTRSPLRQFVEMPSLNWREMADNWFGACCCSFGGISEKLVNRFVDSYKCPKGVCLLDFSAITLCKDDLLGCKFGDSVGAQNHKFRQDSCGENGLSNETMLNSKSSAGPVASSSSQNQKIDDSSGRLRSSDTSIEDSTVNLKCDIAEEETNNNKPSSVESTSNSSMSLASRPGCCSSTCKDYPDGTGTQAVFNSYLVEQNTPKAVELMASQRSFLNGLLGNIFMARSYNLSAEIEWKEFTCPWCSFLLGAYPRAKDDLPVDDGVRLFKCYLSTSLPVGRSDDIFRRYTLERMFTNQLVESAKEELSFRTIIRDLSTKSPTLHVVLLNPNSWCCSGVIAETGRTMESISKLDLHPVIKVLFSDCGSITESQPRMLEEWMTKNQLDDVYLLTRQIEELVETAKSAKDIFPPSCTSFQGLSLLSMQR
uniref:Uncharacterized protein LOC105126637 isoform X1 n=3 Tax=Rhizophora mucronata TaxID=61149 RepID=A0A2P2KK69_RHIMU